VLLAVIGMSWLTRAREDGRRRLDEPGDLVRLEIEAALARGIRVIPVLVDGALMPAPGQLPASLEKLAGRQAVELSPAHFSSDARRLLMTLEKTLTQVPGSPPRPPPAPLPHPAAAWTAPADAEHFCGYCGFPFRPSQQNQEYCNQYPLPAHGRCGRRHQDAQSDEGLRKRLDVTQRVRPDSRRTPEDAIAHEWVRRNRPGLDLSPWQATQPPSRG
jgi:hypothetical protein